MASKIKDQATAEHAARNLDSGIAVAEKIGEPKAPGDKTTSEKLFPEFTTEDGGIINRPVKPYLDASKVLPATVTPEPAPQGQTPPVPAPTVPVYLDVKELTGKMVRLKVDGIEQDVPAETLIKTTQLERHLNAQLMNVAQERKSLEDDRRRLLAQPPTVAPELPKPEKQQPTVKKSPEIEALEARLAQMEQDRIQERALLLPQIQEAGIKRVEQMAKERLGSDDFRDYFGKIRDNAFAELAKPEISANPQARQWFDSDAYYFQTYQEMKLKDLISKPQTASNSNAPVLQTPEGAPVVINSAGQPVSLPSFEGSGGVPSKTSPDADWQSTYNALLNRAQQSGNMEDWKALYRHKVQPRE